MDAARLRFPDRNRPDLPLAVGAHAIGRGSHGLDVVDDADAMVCLCVDRRGAWLTVAEDVQGVHVNGRPVLRMAMLRVGDAIYLDGMELRLVPAAPPRPVPKGLQASVPGQPDPRLVLRGVGGRYHGRCLTLERPRLVGRCREADIRIDEPAFAERHARLELADGQVLLRDLGTGDGSVVNGEPVRDAILAPGDQVMFGVHHRFVLEAPKHSAFSVHASGDDGGTDEIVAGVPAVSGRAWRLPWLLLAALLIASLLAALLLFGSA